jgi:hypothetical protein
LAGGAVPYKGGIMWKPIEKEITLRAYQIWEQNNRPADRDVEFYRQAEKE